MQRLDPLQYTRWREELERSVAQHNADDGQGDGDVVGGPWVKEKNKRIDYAGSESTTCMNEGKGTTAWAKTPTQDPEGMIFLARGSHRLLCVCAAHWRTGRGVLPWLGGG